MKFIIKIIILISFCTPICLAEKEIDKTVTDSTVVKDTILFESQNLLENIIPANNPINLEEKLTQNPTTALFKSMAVPGWGQLGNKRKIKGGLFFALDLWMVLSAIHYGRQASDFRAQFENITDPALNAKKNDYYSLFLDRKDDRNKFTWYAVITSFFAMFDAFVDAHLSGSPKIENLDRLNIGIIPLENNGTKIVVSWNF